MSPYHQKTIHLFCSLSLLFFCVLFIPSASLQGNVAEPEHNQSSDEVLLLGLSLQGSLKTYLVDDLGIQKAGDGIAIPRSSGWWKLDKVSHESPTVQYHGYSIAPAGKKIKARPIGESQGCESKVDETLLFIGSDYISIKRVEKGICHYDDDIARIDYEMKMYGGLNNKNDFTSFELHNLGDLLRYENVPIDVIGQNASEEFKKAAKKAIEEEAKTLERCPRSGSTFWCIVRNKGQWQVLGQTVPYLDTPAQIMNCSSEFSTFNFDFEPPAKITGQTKLPKKWEDYAELYPGLTDIVVSPGNRLTLIVTKDYLEVLKNDKSVGKLNEKDANIVMTQWALGKNAARWRKEVPKVLAGSAIKHRRLPDEPVK